VSPIHEPAVSTDVLPPQKKQTMAIRNRGFQSLVPVGRHTTQLEEKNDVRGFFLFGVFRPLIVCWVGRR